MSEFFVLPPKPKHLPEPSWWDKHPRLRRWCRRLLRFPALSQLERYEVTLMYHECLEEQGIEFTTDACCPPGEILHVEVEEDYLGLLDDL